MSVEGLYDSVSVCQLQDHTAVYVRLKDHTTVSICQVQGSHDSLYVMLKDHTTDDCICAVEGLNVLTTVSVCQVEGSYESVSICQVECSHDCICMSD